MKLIVCMKQVPASATASVDPLTKTIVRTGQDAVTNPYDLYALQTALEELGFTRVQLSPVAIQKTQRTVIPATKLVRTRVSDVVLGELVYMIKADLAWEEAPAFPEEETAAAEEENA